MLYNHPTFISAFIRLIRLGTRIAYLRGKSVFYSYKMIVKNYKMIAEQLQNDSDSYENIFLYLIVEKLQNDSYGYIFTKL